MPILGRQNLTSPFPDILGRSMWSGYFKKGVIKEEVRKKELNVFTLISFGGHLYQYG